MVARPPDISIATLLHERSTTRAVKHSWPSTKASMLLSQTNIWTLTLFVPRKAYSLSLSTFPSELWLSPRIAILFSAGLRTRR